MKSKLFLTLFFYWLLLSTANLVASEIRVGFTTDALTLDPANHRDRETETIIRNMYDGLLTRTPSMEVIPELAVSWKQIDLQTFEFQLRRGVKFHSGDEMTAEDIRYTFERLTKKGGLGNGLTSPRQSLLAPLKEIKVVGKYAVHFILDQPWPFLPAMLPLQEVVSKKFVERVGTKKMATHVNGTGPFKLLQWNKGKSIIMERFEHYYGGALAIPPVGKACVSKVIFEVIPDNEARVSALLSGKVDIINELPMSALKRVHANPKTRVAKVRGTRTFFVVLNNTKPPFNDLRVRKALNHSINKQLLVNELIGGHATAVNGVLSPDAFAFNSKLPAYQYDSSKARKLLAEAGYPDGISVSMEVTETHKKKAEALAKMMRKVGIQVKIVVDKKTTIKQKWLLEKKQGDMWLTSWGNSSLDPVGILVPTLRTKGRGNYSGYSNSRVDQLLDSAGMEINRRKRASLYREAQLIINKEAPWVFLAVPHDLYGISTKIKGWQPGSDSRINLHDACKN